MTTAVAIARPTPASTANGARQPACCPSQVPSGTPSTGASAAPVENSATTRPRTATGKGPVTVADATDQNSAWVRAVINRAPASTAYVDASAATAFPPANRAIVTASN